MKISPILLIAAILLSGILGFFIGRGSAPEQKTTIAAVDKTTVAATEEKEENPIAPASSPKEKEDNIATVETPSPQEEKPVEPIAELKEAEPPTVTSINPTEDAVLKRIKMGISDHKISEVLESIAENLENKKLAYVSSLSQDCSGIFHQIKDSIQIRLPALAQQSTYQYPTYKKIRSSRQIADWYYKKGNLLIVEDPLVSRNSIRPGSVMFFGKSGMTFKNMNIDMLTDRNNNYTRNGAIQHIAVVTSVRTDDNGNVLDYTMMHARYPKGPPASRSGSKEVQSNRTKSLPAFGHWKQQWVAVANIATPK